MEKSTIVQIAHRLKDMGGQASPGAVEAVVKQAEKEGLKEYAIRTTIEDRKLGAAILEYPAVLIRDAEPVQFCKWFDIEHEHGNQVKCYAIAG